MLFRTILIQSLLIAVVTSTSDKKRKLSPERSPSPATTRQKTESHPSARSSAIERSGPSTKLTEEKSPPPGPSSRKSPSDSDSSDERDGRGFTTSGTPSSWGSGEAGNRMLPAMTVARAQGRVVARERTTESKSRTYQAISGGQYNPEHLTDPRKSQVSVSVKSHRGSARVSGVMGDYHEAKVDARKSNKGGWAGLTYPSGVAAEPWIKIPPKTKKTIVRDFPRGTPSDVIYEAGLFGKGRVTMTSQTVLPRRNPMNGRNFGQPRMHGQLYGLPWWTHTDPSNPPPYDPRSHGRWDPSSPPPPFGPPLDPPSHAPFPAPPSQPLSRPPPPPLSRPPPPPLSRPPPPPPRPPPRFSPSPSSSSSSSSSSLSSSSSSSSSSPGQRSRSSTGEESVSNASSQVN